jgi:hypothetical protein
MASRAILLAMIVLAGHVHGARAQNAEGAAALARYLGTWVYEGDGNGGRVSCRSERRWITGNAYVESHRECTTPNGPITQVEVFGFDPQRRVYVYWGFNGRTPSTYATPSIGDTIAWTGENLSAGNRCRTAFAPDGLSAAEECESLSADGSTWRRVSGGTSRKVPQAR